MSTNKPKYCERVRWNTSVNQHYPKCGQQHCKPCKSRNDHVLDYSRVIRQCFQHQDKRRQILNVESKVKSLDQNFEDQHHQFHLQ